MIEWHRFQAYWLRLSAISLIGEVFVDGKAKCAGVRIVCGANDSKFLRRCSPEETVHDCMVALTRDVCDLKDACGVPYERD